MMDGIRNGAPLTRRRRVSAEGVEEGSEVEGLNVSRVGSVKTGWDDGVSTEEEEEEEEEGGELVEVHRRDRETEIVEHREGRSRESLDPAQVMVRSMAERGRQWRMEVKREGEEELTSIFLRFPFPLLFRSLQGHYAARGDLAVSFPDFKPLHRLQGSDRSSTFPSIAPSLSPRSIYFSRCRFRASHNIQNTTGPLEAKEKHIKRSCRSASPSSPR